MNDIGNKTVAVVTLGCKTNQFESAAMRESLEQVGYQLVPFAAGADLVVVNTCTVTTATDAESRNLVRRARRLNQACRVVVTGCYAQIDPQALADLPGVDLVIGNEEKRELLHHLHGSGADRVIVATSARQRPPLSRCSLASPSAAGLLCRFRTAATLVAAIASSPLPAGRAVRHRRHRLYPNSPIGGRGRCRNRPDRHPYRRLRPRSAPTHFTLDLLRRIETETAVRRLRLGSIEPTEIDPALIAHLATSTVVCPHLHIPLQAGDDAVLQGCAAPTGARTFAFSLPVSARRSPRQPSVSMSSPVFPARALRSCHTVHLIEELPVTHLHVFPFSRRPGTAAAAMPGHLPGNIKKPAPNSCGGSVQQSWRLLPAGSSGGNWRWWWKEREERSAQGVDPQLSGNALCGWL